MNHLLYNISVLMIFVGLISLTYYLAKAYNKQECLKQEVIKVNNIIELQNGFTSAHPKPPQ